MDRPRDNTPPVSLPVTREPGIAFPSFLPGNPILETVSVGFERSSTEFSEHSGWDFGTPLNKEWQSHLLYSPFGKD